MSGKFNRPPAGKSWIWLTLDMMKGDAWRSAGINTRRFIDFLMIELMQNGGRKNGKLKAPYHQLEQIGIGAQYIATAINEAEQFGLVHCHRGGERVATTYTLTWIPLCDGTPATDHWRAYRSPKLKPWPEPKRQQEKVIDEEPGH